MLGYDIDILSRDANATHVVSAVHPAARCLVCHTLVFIEKSLLLIVLVLSYMVL